ncbi:hypothetical protein B0A49_03394 [Cryomyces minteri]|uniref:Uncharacterized protein n=1 Tax=Cryomyces minteri TaxID=331657 RepID=A0A4U0XI96_9PEZI|nr:hypothetical protein B0A49_03394 [Cryomyces minteri]
MIHEWMTLPVITRVSKQTRSESLPLYYRKNSFEYTIWASYLTGFGFSRLTHWLRLIGEYGRTHISQLCVSSMGYSLPLRTMEPRWIHESMRDWVTLFVNNGVGCLESLNQFFTDKTCTLRPEITAQWKNHSGEYDDDDELRDLLRDMMEFGQVQRRKALRSMPW